MPGRFLSGFTVAVSATQLWVPYITIDPLPTYLYITLEYSILDGQLNKCWYYMFIPVLNSVSKIIQAFIKIKIPLRTSWKSGWHMYPIFGVWGLCDYTGLDVFSHSLAAYKDLSLHNTASTWQVKLSKHLPFCTANSVASPQPPGNSQELSFQRDLSQGSTRELAGKHKGTLQYNILFSINYCFSQKRLAFYIRKCSFAVWLYVRYKRNGFM